MNPEAFSDLAAARHSVRDFRPDPVPSQVLDAILDDARQAPSWSNTRPFMVALATGERAERLRSAIPGLGDRVRLLPPVRVDYGDNIAVGEGTFVNYGLVALDVARISIGAHCQIGPNVQLLTPVHPLEPTPRACSLEAADPITIGDNVWLGGGVIVCPGVTIGDNCVIGAGSVVTKDIPASSLAVGNPARVLRQLDDSTFGPRHQHPPQETPQ